MHHLSDYFVILAAKTDKIMRKSLIITLIAGIATTLTMVSCNKNVYDEERHGELIHYYSSVDSVDQQHMWMLTQSKTLRYQIPSGSSYEELRLYTSNPLTDENAELMNTAYVSSGQSGSVSLSLPYQQDSIFAALVNGDGSSAVTSISSSQTSVDFTDTTIGRPLSSLKPQTYTFLFEENYPEPGDYDYNDVVLRVSQQRTGENQITIGVTISAVGANKQIAGCIRLVGYRYQDIDSVYTTNGKSFNDGINTQMLYFHKDTDFLIKGRNNEAVLNLFCDAHWAMAFNLSADYGLFQRKKYNVSTSTGDNYQLRSTRTIKYVISFKNANALNYFTLDTLDPFIITDYNAGTWETHTEQFKSAQVLHEYFVPTFKDLPWALMVPQYDFAYPLEGNEIGYRKRLVSGAVAMFGAYTTVGHSFGEWAEDHTRFLDWYLYPNLQLTF
jgi:LruC domain-containing protein